MNKSKRLLLAAVTLILVSSLVFIFTSCGQAGSSTSFAENTKVRMFLTYRGSKFATYNESTPWEGPDGKTYNKGDMLPTWSYIANKLKIDIVDSTPKSGQRGVELFDAQTATGFKDAEIYQGDPRRISDEGINGRFIALNEHFDKLPNFKKFLDENPSIKTQLTQADGNIYMAPYFDDINKLERMFMMRLDWVKKLLDSEAPQYDTARTITSVYKGVYDYAGGKKVTIGPNKAITVSIPQNIVSIQNALGVKNGANLTKALRDYIDENYMNSTTGYTKRSDLFISSKAAYDVDEMVALMRAIKTNPVLLTGENRDLIIFYQRDVNKKIDPRRLAEAWGLPGVQKDDFFYITKDNKIQDVRLTDRYYEIMTYISELYSEGLILQDFDQPRGTVEVFRTYCFQTNDGFMSFDYAASTVSQHDLLPPEDLAKFGTVFEPVVPPAAPWFSSEFEQYSQSNRSIKSDGGWGIASSATGDTLNAALMLLDYPFSEDGLNVMTFGPSGLYWTEYTTIAGEQVPKLIDQFDTDMLKYASGNWSNFMRGFVGSTLPAGHVKNTIAIETQVSNEHYSNGIERIAASGMTLASLSNDVAPERRLSPTNLPLNEDQVDALSLNTFQAYQNEWETRIMKFGFGNDIAGGEGKTPTVAEYKAELVARGLEKMQQIYNMAFDSVKE